MHADDKIGMRVAFVNIELGDTVFVVAIGFNHKLPGAKGVAVEVDGDGPGVFGFWIKGGVGLDFRAIEAVFNDMFQCQSGGREAGQCETGKGKSAKHGGSF